MMQRCLVLLAALAALLSASAALDPPQSGMALTGSLAPATSSLTANPGQTKSVSPIQARIPKPPVPPVTDNPPPFGTVLQEWELQMSGTYVGAGITWCRDSGLFYLMGQNRIVWKLDPTDSTAAIRRDSWVFANLGNGTQDIPWGIAWDADSGCFWISQVIDGDVYAGCYLLRMTLSDGAWRWRGTAADSWLVSDAGNMYWMAGFEKWPHRGYFICAPVAASANNYPWKFDPYTKTSLGRCANGSTVSERGLSLVPWDSAYILTSGWSTSGLVKRDSTGLALESAPGGPADMAVWVPQHLGPYDTVFMYGIVNNSTNILQKMSVGMLWGQLPSVGLPDVLPQSVLAPTGAVDSGQTVVPRLVVRNTGSEAATDVSVWFTIDAGGSAVYADSITHFDIPGRTDDTLSFADWVARGRDSMSVIAWTRCSDDSFADDDTIRRKFLVRVKDIGVLELLQPADTLDSGTVVTPTARVWNFGNLSLDFDVQFRIGPYLSTRTLTLPSGGSTVVAAPDPYTASPGVWAYIVTAVVPGDLHPENNRMTDTIFVRGTLAHDVGVTAILAPGGFLDTATTVTPCGRVKNFTDNTESFWAFFSFSTYSGTPVYSESLQLMVSGNDSADVSFPDVRFAEGQYVMACSTAMPGDQNSTNDVVSLPLRVVPSLQGDVGVKVIVQPPSFVPTNTVITPTATWKNYSTEATSFFGYFALINPYNARVYTKVSLETALDPGEEVTLTFEDFSVGTVEGRWVARCSTFAGDTVPANDVLQKSFNVSSDPGRVLGWHAVAPVPLTPSGKYVKDGGWVTNDAGTDAMYVAKGNKTRDFYSYDPLADAWTQKALIPLGTEFKAPYNGSAGTSDGNGHLFATKGNNTLGFFMFDAAGDTWFQKPEVPLGTYGKKVKGGTSMQYANGFVFLLKGYKNEFYKFDVAASTWETLPAAPTGSNVKWDRGSWIVYDGSQFIYAHKAKYHELWKYDVVKDSWVAQLTGMPMVGATGKVKKSKDGGSAALMMNRIYAFKGGNTNEFWAYFPAEDKWVEDDTIPSVGTSGRKKRIKAGAGLANFRDLALFAIKGNKCDEFWRYFGDTEPDSPAPREGVMAGSAEPITSSLQIGPNPLARGFATMRYSLPQAGLVGLRVYDVTGRSVYAQTFVAVRSGSANLDLRGLPAGIYVLRLDAGTFTCSEKLILQR